MVKILAKKSFTMAEVLLVIAIVGITAALVIPNVSKGLDEEKNVAKVKATYNMLQTASHAMLGESANLVDYIESQNAATDKATASKAVSEGLQKQMKVARDCGVNNTKCFKDKPLSYYNGTNIYPGNFATAITGLNAYSFMLSNGASVSVRECAITSDPSGYCIMDLDIDGLAGPHVRGVDMFVMFLGLNGDIGSTKEEVYKGYDSSAIERDAFTYNRDTLQWVLTKGNMDYINCNDLNWNSKSTCD